VQTNDDIVEIEVQTDEIEESNKWTQYPPDDSKGCGSGKYFNLHPKTYSNFHILRLKFTSFFR
jgi:hypothetical protein